MSDIHHRIFEREAPKVKSWDAFKRLIRFNRFETDPICAPAVTGQGPPIRRGTCAISARGDLPGPHGSPFGGIDAKVLKISQMHKALRSTPIKAPLV